MTQANHLFVSAGPDRGKQITVTPEGIRIGRSSKNDVILVDPRLSRHHCRLFFRPDGNLCVADLGSVNKTYVNDIEIQETVLNPGDIISLGETKISFVPEGSAGKPAGVIDLGLQTTSVRPARAPRRTSVLILVAVLVTAGAVAIWIPKLLTPRRSGPITPTIARPQAVDLSVSYEKVMASSDNIFRYSLTLEDLTLKIEIDDLENNRHVIERAKVSADLVKNLARTLGGAGFFLLSEEYIGVQPDVVHQWDLSITMGRNTHRTRVLNRAEPDAFKHAREILEAFGKNELGLWAIQFSAEKLQEMAQEAYLQGKNLSDEREVKYGNLAAAITSFKEAEWYLQTVEVKPDFYISLRGLVTECTEALEKRYNDQQFLADKAIYLKDWERAASELRILCEMIPEREDERNQQARKKLLDVEARIQALK
jgi:pSer/pThr/pTyr-binding forkhead associated (FHA) protein